MSERLTCPSDMSGEQWTLIERLVPEALPGGRPPKYERREIVNAISMCCGQDVSGTCCPTTCRGGKPFILTSSPGRKTATWEVIEKALCRRVRERERKRPAPTAGIIDSQAVKTSEQGGPHGFDMAKQVSGCNLHVLVDTPDLIWLVHVTAASVQDRGGTRLLLERIFQRGLGRLHLVWVDVAYRAAALFAWIKTHLPRRGLRLEVVGRNAQAKGFEVQPRRRVIERTFGWLHKGRRLSKNYAPQQRSHDPRGFQSR